MQFFPLCPGACWCFSYLCVSLSGSLTLFKVFLLGSVAWSESISISISLCSAPCPSFWNPPSVLWPTVFFLCLSFFWLPLPIYQLLLSLSFSLGWITIFNSSFPSLRPIFLSPAHLGLPVPVLIPLSLAGAVLPVQVILCQVFIPIFSFLTLPLLTHCCHIILPSLCSAPYSCFFVLLSLCPVAPGCF